MIYQATLPLSSQTVSGCLGSFTLSPPAAIGAPVVGTDGATYLEVETSQDSQSWVLVPVDNGVDYTCQLASESYGSTLQLLRITPAGSTQYQSVATTSNRSIALSPGEVIPDGHGGTLAYYVSGGQATIADVSSVGVVQQAINQQPTYGQDNNMVLGDSNTAFVTDGQTVTALSVPGLQVLWNYVSTGGFLRHVTTTAGGGLTIDDSQQGVIQLDSSGNAGTPLAALLGSSPFGITQWDGIASSVLTMLVGPAIDLPVSAFPESAGSGADDRANSQTLAHYFPAAAGDYGLYTYDRITNTIQKVTSPAGVNLIRAGASATIPQFDKDLMHHLFALGFAGHSVDYQNSQNVLYSVGLNFSNAVPNDLLVLPPDNDPTYPIPTVPNSTMRAQISTDAKVVFLGSCFIVPNFQTWWNITPSTQHRALIVPVRQGNSPVYLGHASSAWAYILQDLFGPGHLTVGEAVKHTNNILATLRNEQNHPIQERWEVIGDGNVKLPQ